MGVSCLEIQLRHKGGRASQVESQGRHMEERISDPCGRCFRDMPEVGQRSKS